MQSSGSVDQPTAPVRIWHDLGFQRGARVALWGTILMYPLGAVLYSVIHGAEGALGWIFVYWESLYWLEWFWLAPAILVLALLRRPRVALGVTAAGVILGAVHATVLSIVLSIGVR